MAKSKKDMLAELYKTQPGISVEDAAEAVGCTVAYAQRILPALAAMNNSELVDIGRGLGIPERLLDAWHSWILNYVNSKPAAQEFLAQYHFKHPESYYYD